MVLRRLFLDHPREVGESYGLHARHAGAYGFRLIGAGLAALVHALIPGLHKHTASRAICEMARELDGRATSARESRMRDAGAYDPGL